MRVDLPLTITGVPTLPGFLFCGLAFFVCGAGLALLRPDDAEVRLIGASLMLVAVSTLSDALWDARGFFIGWERVAHFAMLCCSIWPFPMAYHYFSRFPVWRSPRPRTRAVTRAGDGLVDRCLITGLP